METFDLKTPCPKCGSADLSHRFRRTGERIDEMIGNPYEPVPQDLLRTLCRTCGFRWSRRPRDIETDVSTDKNQLEPLRPSLSPVSRVAAPQDENTAHFFDEIQRVINSLSRENISNTQDFVLARFLCDALFAFERAIIERENLMNLSK